MDEESLIAFITREEREIYEIQARYAAEVRTDMNAFAEAYIAAVATMESVSLPTGPDTVDSEIQRLAAVKKSWEADPNPNRKEKVIRMQYCTHYIMLLSRKAASLPSNLQDKYFERHRQEMDRFSKTEIPGSRDEIRWPAQPNAALQQLMHDPAFSRSKHTASIRKSEDYEDYDDRLPPYILSKPLQASDLAGDARLLTGRERKNYADHPEAAIGKIFKMEGGEEGSEVFKVRGVLSVEGDKCVYRLDLDSGTDAFGESLQFWRSTVNPPAESGARVFEVVKNQEYLYSGVLKGAGSEPLGGNDALGTLESDQVLRRITVLGSSLPPPWKPSVQTRMSHCPITSDHLVPLSPTSAVPWSANGTFGWRVNSLGSPINFGDESMLSPVCFECPTSVPTSYYPGVPRAVFTSLIPSSRPNPTKANAWRMNLPLPDFWHISVTPSTLAV
ncbi:hypothetical protein NMY22_g12545 [Coprinellus aureogranulatus]|nr:hypothetical protein NMY22_g12545 [Coprinellus aureogranulatus]